MGKNELLPFLAMVIVQVGYAGMNITSKMAMDSGMKPLILVAYRQIFATLAIIPFAYFFERKTWPKITKHVLFQIFLCSLFGASLNQIFYFVGLNNTSATISCALTNMLPAITFILAVPLGLEAIGIKSKGGVAKIMGTIICIGGAMLLSFYHGHEIGISPPAFHWQVDHQNTMNRAYGSSSHRSLFLGPLLILASNAAMAVWFILQAKMSKNFAAPYTSSALLCFMASIQCIIIAVCTDHKLSDWSLDSHIRSLASIYAGVVGSALALCLMSWSIQRKGPLYVSIFNPLLLVIVALLSWALHMEKLYIGTAIGSAVIVVGLYAVLWGKKKELINNDNPIDNIDHSQSMEVKEEEKDDIEKQQQMIALKEAIVIIRRIETDETIKV